MEKIPEEIHEIVSYLSQSFSSKLLERADLKQDLYLLYLQMRKKEKTRQQDGWYFKKFKWYLLTKYSKEVKRVNKEWEYKLRNCSDETRRKIKQKVGYLDNEEEKKSKSKKRKNSAD
jgi:hypothetical protein